MTQRNVEGRIDLKHYSFLWLLVVSILFSECATVKLPARRALRDTSFYSKAGVSLAFRDSIYISSFNDGKVFHEFNGRYMTLSDTVILWNWSWPLGTVPSVRRGIMSKQNGRLIIVGVSDSLLLIQGLPED
jgi:hypothetical protein